MSCVCQSCRFALCCRPRPQQIMMGSWPKLEDNGVCVFQVLISSRWRTDRCCINLKMASMDQPRCHKLVCRHHRLRSVWSYCPHGVRSHFVELHPIKCYLSSFHVDFNVRGSSMNWFVLHRLYSACENFVGFALCVEQWFSTFFMQRPILQTNLS